MNNENYARDKVISLSLNMMDEYGDDFLSSLSRLELQKIQSDVTRRAISITLDEGNLTNHARSMLLQAHALSDDYGNRLIDANNDAIKSDVAHRVGKYGGAFFEAYTLYNNLDDGNVNGAMSQAAGLLASQHYSLNYKEPYPAVTDNDKLSLKALKIAKGNLLYAAVEVIASTVISIIQEGYVDLPEGWSATIDVPEGASAVAALTVHIAYEAVRNSGTGKILSSRYDYHQYKVKEMLEGRKPLNQIQWLLAKENNEDPAAALDAAESVRIRYDPLIIDLDGDGVETQSITEGVHFDHDNNGLAEQTGWVSEDDGLLVLDRNSDGLINNGNELFGNHTDLNNGDKAANGYEALKELDSNNDGVIDSNDSAYSELQVWQDKNSDGISQADELLSLREAGIASLNMGYQNTNQTDANGNVIRQNSTGTRLDGSAIATADVWFDVNLTRTVEKDLLALSDEIKTLPDAVAFGNVRSLRQAMMRDSALKNLVNQYVAATSDTERSEVLDNLIYKWTDSEAGTDRSNGFFDGKQLLVLEQLVGRQYSLGSVQNGVAANILKAEYSRFKDFIAGQLLSQTLYKEAFSKIQVSYDFETSEFKQDLGAFAEFLSSKVASDEYYVFSVLKALEKISAYSSNLKSEIDVMKKHGQLGALFVDTYQVGSEGSDVLSGTDGDNILRGEGGGDRLSGQSGDDHLFGGADDDILSGGSGNDHLHGGTGNDTLYGGSGDDTYYWGRGDGNDTISNYDYWDNRRVDAADKLQLGAGITEADLGWHRSGDHLVLTLKDSGERLTVDHHFNRGSYRLKHILFSDGSALDLQQVERDVRILTGDDSDNSLQGFGTDDTLHGQGGSDRLNGLSGHDQLFGGEDDDILSGGSGNDHLHGGTGNDTLYGGSGDDTYYWGRGDGNDTISNYDYWDNRRVDAADKLQLGAGIDADNLWFSRSGNSLKVQLLGSDNSVTVQNWYSGSAYKIESIETADATISSADIEALVQAMAVFDAPSGSGEVIPQNIQDQLQPVLAASWKPV